jgi:hypothetical protein
MTLIRLTAAALVLGAAAAPAADTATVRGTIERVNTAAGRLTLATATGEHLTLHAANGATVEVDGHPAKLSDLSKDQRARVTYRDAGGTHELVSVTAHKTTGRDVTREVREALQAAGRYSYQHKDEYVKKLRGVVDDLDDRIDELQQRVRTTSRDARRKLEDQIHALKQKRGVVEDRLNKLKSAGADAWNDVKAGVQNAAEDLRRAIEGVDGSKPN